MDPNDATVILWKQGKLFNYKVVLCVEKGFQIVLPILNGKTKNIGDFAFDIRDLLKRFNVIVDNIEKFVFFFEGSNEVSKDATALATLRCYPFEYKYCWEIFSIHLDCKNKYLGYKHWGHKKFM